MAAHFLAIFQGNQTMNQQNLIRLPHITKYVQGNRPEDPVCPFTTPQESQTKISSFGVQTSYKLTCAIWQSGELLAMGLKYFILLLKTVPSY